MTTVEKDKVATVHYRGTFAESGEEFDSSHGADPMAFLVGHGNMVPGFEQGLLGAAVGEEREFTLSPENAYGEKRDDAVVDISREEFPDDIELELGMVLMSESGPFRIVAITNEIVKCDFNHPLAGETLHFNVEIVEVRDASPEELEHGHVHGPDGHDH
ncbi:MAG: peptidylprolyl isomerase [Candidatus Poseidoniales archaeon]|nr:MAG: peptidylprolyl isomerase [Candidatus Poseidoniales archaeon]